MVAPVVRAFVSLQNLLTLSRPVLGGAVWLVRDHPLATFGLVIAAGLTDILDGWVARRRERSRPSSARDEAIGVWLDPLCDKIFVVLALGAIWAEVRPPLGWLAVILAREVVLVPLTVAYRLLPAIRRRRRYAFRPAFIGKVTTVAQFLAAGAFVLDWRGAQALALLAGASGLIAAVHYATRGQRRPGGDVAAIHGGADEGETAAPRNERTTARS